MYNIHQDLENTIMELSALHTRALDSGNLEMAKWYEKLYNDAVAKLDKLEKELAI